MADPSLSDDMWEAARLLWENTPKITDSDLIKQLAINFGDDVPKSSGTISKRRKKYEWTKNDLSTATDRVEKEGASRKKSGKSRKKKVEESVKLPSKTNKSHSMEKSLSLEEKKSVIESVIDDVVLDAKGRAKIIQKYRKRYVRAGDVFDQALEITLSIKDLAELVEIAQDELFSITYDDSYDADLEIGENDRDKDERIEAAQLKLDMAANVLQKAMMLSKTLTDTATNLAIGLKTLSEVDMPLCGITPDDFMESAQARRLGALSLLDGISEKEEQAREQGKIELYERLREIEATAASEDFGRDLAENNDDIEDIDYTAID